MNKKTIRHEIRLPHFEWAGDYYPVIANLSNGYKLVAHKNAPAITNGYNFETLNQHDDDDEVIKQVKRDASIEFEKWAWGHLRLRLNCPTYD